MPQIYITSIIFTLFAIGIYFFLLFTITPKELRKPLLLLALIELPLEPLSVFFVRKPLDQFLHPLMGENTLYHLTTVCYAPLTEELAKLLPVVIFFLYGTINKSNLRAWMLSIGFGFGIGEAWFIASRLALNPKLADIPWYQFGGFFSERIEVCFVHGAMVGLGLFLSIGKGRWILGTLLSMFLHFSFNLPIYLLSPLVLNADKTLAGVFMTFWSLAFTVGAIAILLGPEGAAKVGRKLFGLAKCPKCQTIYDRPLLAANMGNTRYERCPQ